LLTGILLLKYGDRRTDRNARNDQTDKNNAVPHTHAPCFNE
jgi:hypothetical protein